MAHKHGHIPATRGTDFPVGHVTIRIRETKEDGCTFALMAKDADTPAGRRPFFTGFVTRDMADELRALAKKIDQLNAKSSMEAGE